MLYAILEHRAWDGHRPVSESPGCIIVHHSRLRERVQDFTGRGVLGEPSTAARLRRTGRVYIAGARGRESVVVERLS